MTNGPANPTTLMLVPEAIEAYAAAHSAPVPALVQELIDTTRRELPHIQHMLSGQVEGQLLQMLAASLRATRILEIGMLTGVSAQLLAAALPDDGEVITCELEPRHIEIALAFLARSPHGHKIHVRQGPALATLATLEGPFDLIFIDADKPNYLAYYEAALPLLAPNGILAIDNVLWSGRILDPQTEVDRAVAALNERIAADARVTAVMLTVRDGLTLVRWK